MTEFIESFATQQLLPPWDAQGAQTWGFVVRMTEHRIREYLDAYFNGDYPDRAPFHYQPLPVHQFGLVGVAHFPNVSSQNKRTAGRLGATETNWDHLQHTEVYLSFPVLRYALSKDNLLSDPILVWVEPFIYSDNDSVVFSSREIWGSDMYLGSITRQVGGPLHQLHLDLGMIGIKSFSPRSMSELLAVLHVQTGGDSQSPVQELVKGKPGLEDFIRILGGSGAFAAAMPEGIGPSPYAGGVELHNLKQFRDCYNMGAAIYRAIVASKTTHTEVDNIVLFDPSKVELAFMWSDSIGELLTTLFDVKRPTDMMAPLAHRLPAGAAKLTSPVQTFAGPPPDRFHMPLPASPTDFDWNMDRVELEVEFAFSFSSNAHFEVIGTIHTYGLTPA